MISLQNVSRKFGNTVAVDNISFDVAEGEHFILLGTSGCGKTTTLRMINRLAETSHGTISVNGQNVNTQSPEQLRRSIGYVLQRNSLFPHYTVQENISVVPTLLKWDKNKTNERISTLIKKLHLSQDHLLAYPQQLSGGEAQRVNLARALAADPPILLMDEPFSALDTLIRASIRKEFLELDELKKKTIVMVTHDVQEAFEMGHRVCLMDKGRIMQTGTPEELLYNPANDFVKNFLSDAFIPLAFTITKLYDIWPFLENTDSPVDNNSVSMSARLTISKAIEQIKDKNRKDSILEIKHPENSELKKVNWEGLLSAFSKYQANR